MSNGLNRATLLGNVAIKELKFIPNGQAVLRIRMATNESWIDKAGAKQEKSEFHTVIIWGKRAEALDKILSKGERIYIEGRIETRSWEDKEGGKRYSTEINASEVILLGSVRRDGGGQRDGGGGGGAAADGGAQDPGAQTDEEDLPF